MALVTSPLMFEWLKCNNKFLMLKVLQPPKKAKEVLFNGTKFKFFLSSALRTKKCGYFAVAMFTSLDRQLSFLY